MGIDLEVSKYKSLDGTVYYVVFRKEHGRKTELERTAHWFIALETIEREMRKEV